MKMLTVNGTVLKTQYLYLFSILLLYLLRLSNLENQLYNQFKIGLEIMVMR